MTGRGMGADFVREQMKGLGDRLRRSVRPAALGAAFFAVERLGDRLWNGPSLEARWLGVLVCVVWFVVAYAVIYPLFVIGAVWRTSGGDTHVSPWFAWLFCGGIVAFLTGTGVAAFNGADPLRAGLWATAAWTVSLLLVFIGVRMRVRRLV